MLLRPHNHYNYMTLKTAREISAGFIYRTVQIIHARLNVLPQIAYCMQTLATKSLHFYIYLMAMQV